MQNFGVGSNLAILIENVIKNVSKFFFVPSNFFVVQFSLCIVTLNFNSCRFWILGFLFYSDVRNAICFEEMVIIMEKNFIQKFQLPFPERFFLLMATGNKIQIRQKDFFVATSKKFINNFWKKCIVGE